MRKAVDLCATVFMSVLALACMVVVCYLLASVEIAKADACEDPQIEISMCVLSEEEQCVLGY